MICIIDFNRKDWLNMGQKTTLVVMAAGMGSRFGGLKQAAAVGPKGEMIIDYSVADAIAAGFSKAVFIIRKDIEKDFRTACGKRIEKMIDTEYVYQEMNNLPKGYTAPPTRTKPWGTGQAILCAEKATDTPFAVVNADDYYGPGAFRQIHDFLANEDGMGMVGYKLGNTLSKNGSVSRGICEIDGGYLKKITEKTDIPYDTDIPKDTIVSMNMWGLRPDIFPILNSEFESFLKLYSKEEKKEFFLPSVIDDEITKNGKKVRVLVTDEVWHGITYREDLAELEQALKERNDI